MDIKQIKLFFATNIFSIALSLFIFLLASSCGSDNSIGDSSQGGTTGSDGRGNISIPLLTLQNVASGSTIRAVGDAGEQQQEYDMSDVQKMLESSHPMSRALNNFDKLVKNIHGIIDNLVNGELKLTVSGSSSGTVNGVAYTAFIDLSGDSPSYIEVTIPESDHGGGHYFAQWAGSTQVGKVLIYSSWPGNASLSLLGVSSDGSIHGELRQNVDGEKWVSILKKRQPERYMSIVTKHEEFKYYVGAYFDLSNDTEGGEGYRLQCGGPEEQMDKCHFDLWPFNLLDTSGLYDINRKIDSYKRLIDFMNINAVPNASTQRGLKAELDLLIPDASADIANIPKQSPNSNLWDTF